jgi:hypothetical protein
LIGGIKSFEATIIARIGVVADPILEREGAEARMFLGEVLLSALDSPPRRFEVIFYRVRLRTFR